MLEERKMLRWVLLELLGVLGCVSKYGEADGVLLAWRRPLVYPGLGCTLWCAPI